MTTRRLYRPAAHPTAPLRGASPRRRGVHPLAVVLAALAAAFIAVAGPWGALRVLQARYAQRIYPNVRVGALHLGDMELPEARAALADAADDLAAQAGVVVVSDGEAARVLPWRELGVTLDVDATLDAAYAIGHSPGDDAPRRWLGLWRGDHTVEPVWGLDLARARAALDAMAPEWYRAATAPTLRLADGAVVVEPGEPGRELDVEASTLALVAAAQEGGPEPVVLAFRTLEPPTIDPAPLQDVVDDLADQELRLHAYELVTDRAYTWTLGRDQIVRWFRLEEGADGEPTVRVDPDAIRAALATLSAEIGESAGLRLDEAAEAVRLAHARGGGDVRLEVIHPPGGYVVREGDNALAIAARHGMPLWALAQANPGVDLDFLRLGQQVVIPSQDVLTPNPPVPHKRIVIDIGEQRLRAYERGELVYDWVCSTGREGTPTLAGTFQVLFKEAEAYASLWDLRMPHFIAVYKAAPDFHNGIHALPILSSGHRLWSGALGSPASYGCIILGVEEAETLYEWAEVGVTVVIRP